jgi:restriction endonuclease
LDANRRATGASLELKIRLRQPVLKPDIVDRTEKWLFLRPDSVTLSPHESSSQNPSTPAQASIHSISKETLPVSQVTPTLTEVNKPASVEEENSKKENISTRPSGEIQPQASSNELENAIHWIEMDTDHLVSNLVLEAEIQLAQTKEIAAKAKKDTIAAEAAEDRRSACQVKLQLLQLNVEMGVLSMVDYRKTLVEALALAKEKALTLKRGNRLDLAAQALQRIKLMQQEVAEIDQIQVT